MTDSSTLEEFKKKSEIEKNEILREKVNNFFFFF